MVLHSGTPTGIVCAAIMPHGFSLVPELSEDTEGGLRTREALREVGRRFAAAAPEVIVVATPHGFRVPEAICVADASRGAGALSWRERRVEQNVALDRRFAAELARAAERRDLPLILHGYAGEGTDAVVPLDWGVLVPLWFLGHGCNLPGSGHVLADPPERDEGPAVVNVSPSPRTPADALIGFGRAIVEAATEDGRRVAYVASCDWSHSHRADGPYGYHPQAAAVDAVVLAAVRAGRLGDLAAMEPGRVASAVVDGVPQALILAGMLAGSPLSGEVLTYEAPTYYGMLVAVYG